MSDRAVVLLGVGLYLVASAVIGFVAAKRIEGSDDFIVAGRRLPLWMTTATLMATWMGAGTAMGAAGAAYDEGFLGVIADPFGAALCLFLAGAFYIRVMRRMRLLTIVDFFDEKYGQLAGILSALALVAVYIGWTGSQLVAFGFVLHTLAGISTTAGIIVATIIVLAYTAAGGMWAVAITDFFQITILILGLAVILPLVVADGGGWDHIAAQLPEGTFRITPVEKDAASWLNYFRAWAVIGLGNIPAQDLMQRSLSAKNENVAQNAAYLAGFGYLTVGLIPVLLGIVGTVTLPGLENPEFVVPQLALEHLPALPMAMFIGALLAAIMSSADSALLAPASILGGNVVRYVAPDAREETVFAWTRWSVPVIGLIALTTALWSRSVYDLFVNSFSVLLVALFVPLTAGIWWKKANRTGAVAAMVTGVVVWLGATALAPELPGDVFGLAGSVVAMLVAAPLTQESDPPGELRDREGNVLPMADRLGRLNPFDRRSRLATDEPTVGREDDRSTGSAD